MILSTRLDKFMITDLDITVDLQPLLADLTKAQWDSKNRCCLNTPKGNWLFDDYEILPQWQGSSFDNFLTNLPFRVGEARLMKLTPGTCYPCHSDLDDRYHLNLTSNDQCYLIDLESHKMHPVKSDGKVYYMNANLLHTAVNFGDVDRVQLVIRKPFERISDQGMTEVSIKFLDSKFNFRYQFDQKMSPIIGMLAKEKNLSWFEPISETQMNIKTTRQGIDLLLKTFNDCNFKYELLEKK